LYSCMRVGYGVCKKNGREGEKECGAIIPPSSSSPREKKYCGTKEQLPQGYTAFGTRHDCLKKGFGVCMCSKKKAVVVKRFYERYSQNRRAMAEWVQILVNLPEDTMRAVLDSCVLRRHRATGLYGLHLLPQ